ncbi:unnamed protein product [Closterium sp. NIES-53]
MPSGWEKPNQVGKLDDAWRAEFGDDAERPCWADLLRSGVAIFDLDFDVILFAMYALSVNAEGDYYRCVPPNLGIEAAALGASECGTLPGTAPTKALHTFMLGSRASGYLFRDNTTLTPLRAPVPVQLVDPSGGPVVARSSTVVPCPAIPSGSLSGLHLPSFSTNLESTAALQDAMVTTTTPGGQRVSICTCTRAGHHLATFTCRPGSSLYTLATKPPQVSALGQDFCRGEGILQSFTLPASPQQNGIAERRIGLVVEVARTSMIHAAAPHFLWPFAVRYAAHKLNLWPRVSLPETSPTLRWTGKVGDALVFRVRGPRAFVHDASANNLSARAIPCVFLGFVPDAPGWQFYHPTSGLVLPSQDVTFDKLVPFYLLFPYVSAPLPPPPLFLAPDPPPGVVLGEVAVDSRAARGTAFGGAEPGGAEPGGGEPGGAEPGGAKPRGAETGGAEPGGAETWGATSFGGSACASPRLSLQQLREWLVLRACLRNGATGAGGAGVTTGAGVTVGTTTIGPGGACTRGSGAAETGGVGGAEAGDPTESGAAKVGGSGDGGAGVQGARAGGAGAGGAKAVDLGGAVRLRLYFIPLLQQLLDFAAACRLDYATALIDESASASPPSVGGECALGTDECENRQEDIECFAAAIPRFASMLLAPEGDPAAPDIPTPRSYVEAIMGPYSSQWQAVMDAEMASWKSTGTNVDEVHPPRASMVDGMWIFRYDYELHSLDFSTAFLQVSLHEEIRLRRQPGFTGSFHAGTQWSLRRPVYGLRLAPREWHDTLRTTLAPSIADPSLFLRTDTLLPPFYVLVYVADLVFATADTKALTLVKSELQKRHTCTDQGELCSYLGLQITRDRARRTITLTQLHMVHQVLQRFGFQFSLPQPAHLSTSHSLSAPPSDKSVEPSGPYLELVDCLMFPVTCTRPGLVYPLSLFACYMAPGANVLIRTGSGASLRRLQ